MRNLLVFVAILALTVSCKNENKQSVDQESTTLTTDPGIQNADQAPGTVNIPAGPDGIVHHYICADLCTGGHSPNPGTCPVCGKALAHNQAFHDQQQQSPAIQADPNAGSPVQMQQPQQPQTETVNIPAGADGIVHHYICTAGCKGGHSENAGNCPVCKKPLAHNQAWHNQ